MSTTHRRTQPTAVSLATLVLLVLVGSCSEDKVTGHIDTLTATQGNLLVTVITTGPDPDNDGYRLVVDHADVDHLQASSTRSMSLSAGEHSVELADIAPNCQISGVNARNVTIKAGGESATTFNLDCPHFGALEVSVVSFGDPPGPSGYLVYVDGERRDSLGPQDHRIMPLFLPRTYLVRLAPIGARCSSADGLSREAAVPDGGLASLQFEVTCLPRIIDLAGEKLIVVRPDQATGRTQIVLMTPDAAASEVLADSDPGDASASVSADGTTLLYLHWTVLGRRLTLLNILTLEATNLPTTNVTQAALSPDGTRIAFLRGSQLLVMPADGSDERLLVGGVEGGPYWSPDGRQIAFTMNRTVRVVGVDGGVVQQLGGEERAAGPWSPDGRSMLVTGFVETNCSGGYYYWYYYGPTCQYVTSTLFVRDLQTGAEQRLGGDPDNEQRWSPAWAADGQSVFFLAGTGNNVDVYNVRLSGGLPVNVTSSPVGEAWVAVTHGIPVTSALRAAHRRP